MRNARCRLRAAIAGAIILFSPVLARASGSVPFLPETEAFSSHEQCLKALQEAHFRDRLQVQAFVRKPNGDTTEVNLDTKGIETTDGGAARYEAVLWYHNGRYRADLKQTETRHSYEHHVRSCDGAVMQITGEQGFTLSTFDPAEPPTGAN